MPLAGAGECLTRPSCSDPPARSCSTSTVRSRLCCPRPQNMHAADAGQAALAVHEIDVARAVGVRSIGYAKNPRRGAELREAGADAITDSISDLVTL